MEKRWKIYFISFQSINGSRLNGMTKLVVPIINSLPEKVKKQTIYIISSAIKTNESFRIETVNQIYVLILKLMSIFNNYVFQLSSYKTRYIQERMYDFFLSIRIVRPITLLSTTYLYHSTKKNKKLGGANVYLAGNPDDYQIHQLLKNEQIKHNVRFDDAYTFKKRIDFVSKSLFTFDHIITFTLTQYDSYVKRISKDKISLIESHIIPNPISFPEVSSIQPEKLIFCFVAHPFWLKGLPYLLEAWSHIEAQNITLRIAGRIDEHLQEFIDLHYSELENVEYLGWVKDLNMFYRTSDICIVPSLLDAGPATVAEAMYCGLPVIVSDGCGARTLIKNGENGFVVPSENAEAIAKSIKWIINNPKVLPLMGQKAKETILELEKGNQNKKVADHIMKVISDLKLEKQMK